MVEDLCADLQITTPTFFKLLTKLDVSLSDLPAVPTSRIACQLAELQRVKKRRKAMAKKPLKVLPDGIGARVYPVRSPPHSKTQQRLLGNRSHRHFHRHKHRHLLPSAPNPPQAEAAVRNRLDCPEEQQPPGAHCQGQELARSRDFASGKGYESKTEKAQDLQPALPQDPNHVRPFHLTSQPAFPRPGKLGQMAIMTPEFKQPTKDNSGIGGGHDQKQQEREGRTPPYQPSFSTPEWPFTSPDKVQFPLPLQLPLPLPLQLQLQLQLQLPLSLPTISQSPVGRPAMGPPTFQRPWPFSPGIPLCPSAYSSYPLLLPGGADRRSPTSLGPFMDMAQSHMLFPQGPVFEVPSNWRGVPPGARPELAEGNPGPFIPPLRYTRDYR
jgi:hypothetical protein